MGSEESAPAPPSTDGARGNSSPSTGQGERRAIARRAGIVAAGTTFSRVLGMVREQVFAALFTRAATDVFFVAFLIPNVLRQLLAEGAVQNGVLPVLTQVQTRYGPERARLFFRSLRGFSLLVLLAVTGVGMLSAPWLVDLFAGGLRDDPEQWQRAVHITRWVFPYIFFMGTAALGMAALNTQRRFVVSSFAPALLNVAFIACALGLAGPFGALGLDPLLALAAGVLLGGALQVVAQWPSLRAIGYLSPPTLKLGDPHVRDVLRRMAPALFGFGVYYLDVVVARHLLSGLGPGALSYFSFAQRLCDFPQGIFVMAVQSATLPSLALLAARGDREEIVRTLSQGLRLALFVAVPATIALMGLATPIVIAVYERGHFDALASSETAAALVAQSAGLWAIAAVRQLVIVFYALGDTRSPVWIASLDFLVFLSCALLLRPIFGHIGISWAVSLASLAQLLLLIIVLHRRLGHLDLPRIALTVGKILLASLLGLTGARGLLSVWPISTPVGVWPGIASTVAFGVCTLLGAWVLRTEELRAITGPLLRRWSSRKASTEPPPQTRGAP